MCSCWINQNTTVIINFLTLGSILLTQTAIFTLYNKPKKAKLKHDQPLILFYSNINQTVVISIIIEGGDTFGHTLSHRVTMSRLTEKGWQMSALTDNQGQGPGQMEVWQISEIYVNFWSVKRDWLTDFDDLWHFVT